MELYESWIGQYPWSIVIVMFIIMQYIGFLRFVGSQWNTGTLSMILGCAASLPIYFHFWFRDFRIDYFEHFLGHLYFSVKCCNRCWAGFFGWDCRLIIVYCLYFISESWFGSCCRCSAVKLWPSAGKAEDWHWTSLSHTSPDKERFRSLLLWR